MDGNISFPKFQIEHEKLGNLIEKSQFTVVIEIMNNSMLTHQLSYLIYIYAYKFFHRTLQWIEKQSNLTKQMVVFCLLPQQIYSKFFQKMASPACIASMKKIKGEQNFKVMEKKDNFKMTKNKKVQLEEVLQGLLNVVGQVNNGKKLQEMMKKVMEFKVGDDIYLEISLNWMREMLDQELKQNTYICCKNLFRKDEVIDATENKNQEFKRYVWPIIAPNIKNHIKKTLVGFLNMYGGIIFVGIYEDKFRKNTIEGIKLDKTKHLKEVYEFFKGLVSEVFPQHPHFKVRESMGTKFENTRIFFNEYISIEFLPVIASNQYYNLRTSKDVEKTYIIKVFIKIGYPKHFYHLINNEQIDFFVRNNQNVEKKQFSDAHGMIYERLDKFQEANQQKKPFDRKIFHNYCQYDMDFTLEDEDILSSDEDYD